LRAFTAKDAKDAEKSKNQERLGLEQQQDQNKTQDPSRHRKGALDDKAEENA